MKLLLTLLIILILTSCKNRPKADNEFEKYFEQIKEPVLPVMFDCYNDSTLNKYSNNDTLSSKFKPEGCSIFGRLNVHKNIVSIIYLMAADFYYPTIFTYKFDGTPIDTLCLYSGASCDGFPGQWSRSIARIDKNNLITLMDTLGTYQVDSVANIIKGSDSLIISTYKYKLDKSGFFNKVFDNKLTREGNGEHINKFFN